MEEKKEEGKWEQIKTQESITINKNSFWTIFANVFLMFFGCGSLMVVFGMLFKLFIDSTKFTIVGMIVGFIISITVITYIIFLDEDNTITDLLEKQIWIKKTNKMEEN